MAETIRVAAVDDYPIMLAGIRRALQRAADITIVGEGLTAADACRIAAENAPDIILLDIAMPGGGIAAAREILAKGTPVRIIMLTAASDDEQVSAALAAGAMGYVLKGAGGKELLDAIRTVHSGAPYITPSLASRMLVRKEQQPGTVAAEGKIEGLNEREQQILDLAATGMTNEEIGQQLNLATSTVKNYMSKILDKMQVRNRAEAAAVRLQS